MKGYLLFFNFFVLGILQSQTTVVKGKVTESASNDPIPFAVIYFKNTNNAVQADFEGYFSISTKDTLSDTLVCTSDGFYPKYKEIKLGDSTQSVNIQLELFASELKAVVFTSGEDPAYAIIRKAVAQKDTNNKKKLNAYEYDSYTKIELDIDNISNKLRHKRGFRQIATFMDSLQKIVGDDGKPILPIYISESISKVFYKNNLPKTTEKILATRIKGIGVQDGSLVSQLIGSSFVEYNFYNDNISIIDKNVPSPLSNNWKIFYKFILLDSAFIDNEWCYKIDVYPKNKLDVVFRGNMWIAENTWAIKRADFSIGKEANINFIEKIKIQQEYQKTDAGPYFPVKGRIVVDISELADSSAGMLAKYYFSVQNLVCEQPKHDNFYKNPIELDPNALSHSTDENYWQVNRHDSLTNTELNVYHMIDSLRELPVIKTYTEIIDLALNGYKKIGKIDFGPYLYLLSNNTVEGWRIRLGFRTNASFSRKLVLKGYAAYGFRDEKIKYGGGVKYIFSRKNWTEGEVNYSHDIGQLAFYNLTSDELGIFSAFSKWGQQRRPFYSNNLSVTLKRDLFSGFSTALSVTSKDMQPLFYYSHFDNIIDTTKASVTSTLVNTEASIAIRYAYREILLQNDNERISMGTNKQIPILSLICSQGIKGFYTPFGTSQFNYFKANFRIQQRVNVSFLGTSSFDLNMVKYFNYLPYPLLTVHKGNETFFYRYQAFNLMNFFEFISDEYVTLHYMHNFNGFFMNRIPLLKKLKIREFVGMSFLNGTIAQQNQNYIPYQYRTLPDGKADYQSLGAKPYIELDYGIENILKFLRIDFIHRLTYNHVDYKIHKFGIKLSGQFKI